MSRPHRVIVATAAIAFMAIAVVAPVALMYHRLYPDRIAVDDDPGRHGIAYESVSFASPVDGAPLEGWYMASPRPTGRSIVIAPGLDNTGSSAASPYALPLASSRRVSMS